MISWASSSASRNCGSSVINSFNSRLPIPPTWRLHQPNRGVAPSPTTRQVVRREEDWCGIRTHGPTGVVLAADARSALAASPLVHSGNQPSLRQRDSNPRSRAYEAREDNRTPPHRTNERTGSVAPGLALLRLLHLLRPPRPHQYAPLFTFDAARLEVQCVGVPMFTPPLPSDTRTATPPAPVFGNSADAEDLDLLLLT